jgi:hypothetical protein
VRLSALDIGRALEIRTRARRCITVENETTFHELAKLRSGELLVQTSYPGSGTLALLERLPEPVQLFHFGDTDPSGFEILFELRKRLRREVRSLFMEYREEESSAPFTEREFSVLQRLMAEPAMDPERPALEAALRAGKKGAFEQESLGRPSIPSFPFIDESSLHF